GGRCGALAAKRDLCGRVAGQDIDRREPAGLQLDVVASGDRERCLGDGNLERGSLEADQGARNLQLGESCAGADQHVGGLYGDRQSLRLAAPSLTLRSFHVPEAATEDLPFGETVAKPDPGVASQRTGPKAHDRGHGHCARPAFEAYVRATGSDVGGEVELTASRIERLPRREGTRLRRECALGPPTLDMYRRTARCLGRQMAF